MIVILVHDDVEHIHMESANGEKKKDWCRGAGRWLNAKTTIVTLAE